MRDRTKILNARVARPLGRAFAGGKLARALGEELRITNYEMETSALYGLSGLLGHRACTICAVVANRLRKEYSKDHHAAIEKMIDQVLERLVG